MGLACSKGSLDEEGEVAPTIVRLSPFRPRRCSSLSRRMLCAAGAPGAGAPGDCAVPSLLSLAADAAAAGLAALPAHALAALPADLSQLLLERLVSTAMLDDAAIARLASLGLHFFSLPLGGYPELVRPAWLRCLASPSLEAADLSKTGVSGGLRARAAGRFSDAPDRCPCCACWEQRRWASTRSTRTAYHLDRDHLCMPPATKVRHVPRQPPTPAHPPAPAGHR